MPVRQQDRRCVSLTPPVPPCRYDQPVNLVGRQILARPHIGMAFPLPGRNSMLALLNCPIFG
jgi:hypothetical protein